MVSGKQAACRYRKIEHTGTTELVVNNILRVLLLVIYLRGRKERERKPLRSATGDPHAGECLCCVTDYVFSMRTWADAL